MLTAPGYLGRARKRPLSRGFGERVLELVGMLSVGDLDRHLARQAGQLTGARVRDDSDGQLLCAARHGAAVLEYEGAAATVQGSSDVLDRDVTGRALDACHGGQHLAPA